MISVHLDGGLGNQLFQLAFLDWMSKKTGKLTYINSLKSPRTVHSNEQYFNTIFKNWKPLYKSVNSVCVREHSTNFEQTREVPVKYIGYFQKYEYADLIRDEFIAKLCFDESILDKYPDFYQSYPFLVKKVCKGDNLDELEVMFNKLRLIESGERSLASVELKYGQELKTQYLDPVIKKND